MDSKKLSADGLKSSLCSLIHQHTLACTCIAQVCTFLDCLHLLVFQRICRTGDEVTPQAEISVESSDVSGESVGAAVDEKEEGEIEQPVVQVVLEAEDLPVVAAAEVVAAVETPGESQINCQSPFH